MIRGIGVSPGVALGSAYCISAIFVDPTTKALAEEEIQPELARFDSARDQVAEELRQLTAKLESQVSSAAAAIFRMHESILMDPIFAEKIRGRIQNEKHSAQSALHEVLGEYNSLLSRTTDAYLRERVVDVRDVVLRLSGKLSDVFIPARAPSLGPLVLVAEELLPSHVITLGEREVAAIVTQTGGQTSHAAILARARGIPAVSGLPNLLTSVSNGDLLIVDGSEGCVISRPDPEIESAYRKKQREFTALRGKIAENRDLPARTGCGCSLEILANVNGVADARAAQQMGAGGIGLYRTEYLFLSHASVPDEEEQTDVYRAVLEAAPNKRLTIRTLDLGGDKAIPYLGQRYEANPFLGWRSIRLSAEHPQFFLTQIRAILRACAAAPAEGPTPRLMFPMLTTLEETRKVLAMVRKARHQLQRSGQLAGRVDVGAMIEVPAAAVVIDHILAEVDFVSIGSNDLVQYLMAADRDNPKVSHLCQPLAPAVLRVLHRVIQAGIKFNKPVTLCGEMAGMPRAFLLLLGLGLRSFSTSPAFIPTIKRLAERVSLSEAEAFAQRAMKFRTVGAVKRYMKRQLLALAPDLQQFETD